MKPNKLKVLKNDDISGVKCLAYFGGKDGLGTCNTDCQWWRDAYLEDGGCIMWKDDDETK